MTVDPSERGLDEALTCLSGVGPALAQKLDKIGLRSIGDLLLHLPLRFEDRTRIQAIVDLRPMQSALIEGEITDTRVLFGRRRSLRVTIADDSGQTAMRLFHFSAAQKQALRPGQRIRAFGEARPGSAGLEFYHPEYRLIGECPEPLEGRLTPVYGTTEGVGPARIRALVEQALQRAGSLQSLELLPAKLRERFGMPHLEQCLRTVHAPPAGLQLMQLEAGEHPAFVRLVLEELAAHQLGVRSRREAARCRNAHAIQAAPQRLRDFLATLPFQLTGDQQAATQAVLNDLTEAAPMQRLLQGDVGCGKTVVAAIAAAMAGAQGLQTAFMAPTELLAEQHYANLGHWLEPAGLRVALLTGSLRKSQRTPILEQLRNGEIQVMVGTHALFQADVEYQRLALAIIDEQHRFGVAQRLALHRKGEGGGGWPHQLAMTATPIPRTLSQTLYADLDHSLIRERPPGRQPVQTAAVSQPRRGEVMQRIQVACSEGRQAYWVCTLIEESEELQCQAAEATALELREALPSLQIGLVHGRMKAADKSAVMNDFKDGRLDLLVATTVIEVGVDVAKASLMVIDNIERLGLSQAHQLRGRVGRGRDESYCVLLYQPPLGETARARIQVLKETCDGFRIAEEDLRLRGPGDLLGIRQAGLLRFRLADLGRDAPLLTQARALADQIWDAHPELVAPLIRRWLPEDGDYGAV